MAQFRTDTNKISSDQVKSRYEINMLSDGITPSGTLTDAFGRLRVSEPFTLFDSFHRYRENRKWVTLKEGSGNTEYKIHESAVNMTVGTTAGDKVYRTTKRVFAYQPGKSLLILNTFAMNEPKANLVQSLGYFNAENGIYLKNDGQKNYLVLRSNVTGNVGETTVAQEDWNFDKFDGNGYSSLIAENPLLVSRTNIFWIDLEWLGVGDVRCGFFVHGKPLVAHVFHNDNVNLTTYMTTAILPLRYEIENVGETSSNSSLKQICSSVISEAGYDLKGTQRTIGVPTSTPKDLGTAGTFTPIVSIRLKDANKDAVVIPSGGSFFGVTNNTSYRYKIITGGTLENASWQSVSADSSVEYDLSATSITDGTDRAQGYVHVSSGSGAASHELRADEFFSWQLERDEFASSNNGIIFTIAAAGTGSGNDGLGHISWQEITE